MIFFPKKVIFAAKVFFLLREAANFGAGTNYAKERKFNTCLSDNDPEVATLESGMIHFFVVKERKATRPRLG